MKVSIRECLELSAFSGAQVLAGKNNLGRDVKTVSVLEARNADDMKFYEREKGQLLMTGFFAVGNDVDT